MTITGLNHYRAKVLTPRNNFIDQFKDRLTHDFYIKNKTIQRSL